MFIILLFHTQCLIQINIFTMPIIFLYCLIGIGCSFTNHLRAIQKSDEFWLKYNKLYETMNENEKDLFIDVTFETSYRMKYLSEKEKIQYEKWLDKLIPDNYFNN